MSGELADLVISVELRLCDELESEDLKKYKLPSSHPIAAPSGTGDERLPSSSDSSFHGRMNLGRDCEKLDTMAVCVSVANVRDSETFMAP